MFRVKSQSHVDVTYIIDIEAYTCTCYDWKAIKFCKHLAAVQAHYHEVLPLQTLDSITHVQMTQYEPRLINPPGESPSYDPSRLLQKIERLTARMRMNPEQIPSLGFEVIIDQELNKYEGTQLLPTRSPPIPPNQKSWSETKAVMVPVKKTRQKRVGDSSYGAGERSGKKARSAESKAFKKMSVQPCNIHQDRAKHYHNRISPAISTLRTLPQISTA